MQPGVAGQASQPIRNINVGKQFSLFLLTSYENKDNNHDIYGQISSLMCRDVKGNNEAKVLSKKLMDLQA